MRASLLALLAVCIALTAAAADEATVRSKWHAVDIPVAGQKAAPAPGPFAVTPAPQRAPVMTLKSGGACGAADFELCVDSSGRISMPGAKRFLPELPGLTPERLSVKRTGVVFGYSF